MCKPSTLSLCFLFMYCLFSLFSFTWQMLFSCFCFNFTYPTPDNRHVCMCICIWNNAIISFVYSNLLSYSQENSHCFLLWYHKCIPIVLLEYQPNGYEIHRDRLVVKVAPQGKQQTSHIITETLDIFIFASIFTHQKA